MQTSSLDILDTSSSPTSSASVEVVALASSHAVCKVKDLCVSRSAAVVRIQRRARVCREGTGAGIF